MQVYVIALIYSFVFQNFQNAEIVAGNFQTRQELFIVEKNKKIRSVALTSLGKMSQTQCAALCVKFGERCCEITYITSSRECKLDQSGCCHSDFDYISGTNLIQRDRTHVVNKTLSVTNGGSLGVWACAEFCTRGHYAIGFRMKIEPPNGDNTELNAIEIVCGSRASDRYGDMASSGQQVWGDWTRETLCPPNAFLVAFSLQVHQYSVNEDSTGANYVRFRCRYFKDEFDAVDLNYPPGYGPYGSYGEWSDACPMHSAICGLQTKVEAHQGYGDDTALNDVIFFCCQ
ncbi:Vitelline membrane outer layer protein 1 homolog [Mytilus edulis]|uniref:Vitelline membrane outer layer protein 1 homolog n=1 Tax=Mytilus edulis TaxID=6550 RepID=A0A8S3S5I7_MYTED|nr:Vitelline membrane outer layer protein 1 homolog [Mytilus edulis]